MEPRLLKAIIVTRKAKPEMSAQKDCASSLYMLQGDTKEEGKNIPPLSEENLSAFFFPKWCAAVLHTYSSHISSKIHKV